jgi:hypothetical protein
MSVEYGIFWMELCEQHLAATGMLVEVQVNTDQ